MRNFYTFVFLVFAAIVARAADYTEPVVVTVNGNSSEQSATISVEQKGATYDLTLKNFVLVSDDTSIGVGNVAITGIEPVKIGDTVLLQTSRIVTVAPGDDPNVLFWMASLTAGTRSRVHRAVWLHWPAITSRSRTMPTLARPVHASSLPVSWVSWLTAR